jgi:pimeloyl-ACP methyl ester carboxylesterase
VEETVWNSPCSSFFVSSARPYSGALRAAPGKQGPRARPKLAPSSSPLDAYPLTDQPAVPTRFIYALYDEIFEPDWSRWVAREVALVDPSELPTGHFLMAEDPDALAALLAREADAA